ncbi:MAG TPA: ATP-binding protein [Bradyrhizobium sp.]|nr:ATP-binding protein [Bradyrhizobium sp.]
MQYVLGVVEDVTERKQLDDQLRQAQKMEAVGNLTGGIAHDFNNLLTVIIGNLDLLREDVAGHVEAEQKIDTIAQAAERGADLTRHMLMFSRRQPLQAEEIDINTLIAGTTRLLSRALGGNIAINARDAMPTGGALTIATRLAHFDAEYAAHHAEVAAGAYVLIAISDTGTGIPPDVVERIFEPFFTTKPTGQGTGLGLSMGLRLYPAVGRTHQGVQRSGVRHDVQAVLAARHRPGFERSGAAIGAAAAGDGTTGRQSDDSGGRGQPRPARHGRASPAGPRFTASARRKAPATPWRFWEMPSGSIYCLPT